jgi:hypothetical protein
MGSVVQKNVSSPIDENIGPYPRLCQAYVLMGRVFRHHNGEEFSSESTRFVEASKLYGDITLLARKLTEEADSSNDYVSLAAPLALTYSTICALCDPYSCPKGAGSATPEASAMQVQAVEGLQTVSASIAEFAKKLDLATPNMNDLDRLSPIIMDAIYSAASNNAWFVRESGNESNQVVLDTLRHILRRFGGRWRSAAEYLRILEAQEFTYAVGSAAT